MKHYWDKEIEKFDKIYGETKNPLEKFMDLFRKDFILERAQIVYGLSEKLNRGATIVDLGCGTGRQSIELAKRGFKVYGFDISERAVELANRQAKAMELEIPFEKSDIVKKAYPQCDLIIGLGLMDYLKDDEAIQILKQVSELKCKFFFSFPYKSLKSYVRYIYRRLSGTKIYLHSPEEIIAIFSSVGIKDVKIISENLGASIVFHNLD